MTVKELKEVLNRLPEDYKVYIFGEQNDYIAEAKVVKHYEEDGNKGIMLEEY